jgi:hypothetical protein
MTAPWSRLEPSPHINEMISNRILLKLSCARDVAGEVEALLDLGTVSLSTRIPVDLLCNSCYILV